MALDYRKCAQEIVDHIGGRENIAQAAHCATRLRLVIKDNDKVEKDYIEDVDGVKGLFESNGQLQIIIGTGTVNKVYDEFLAYTGMDEATKDDVKAAAAAKQPLWKRLLKPIGDVFVPILPAIVASGLMMGLVEALGKAIPSFSESDWYAFLDMISNTAFAFLPVIVAVSAARVFGGNIFLGAVIGLAMVHTNLLNGWNVANTEAINAFFGVTNGVIPEWHLFGPFLPIRLTGYQGHVIPVIIAVFLMCKIEKWLHKHVPEMLDLFIVPLVTVLTTTLLTFTIIGPIFATAETWVLKGAEVLVANVFGAAVMGALYPWTVIMGLHHMYNVIEAGMLGSVGLNTWMPIASAANFAQFGACLAVGLKAKNQKTKVVAIPSAMSAALGITEPAIFGVNLRFFKPFICAMIGGIAGSFYGALTKIGATAYGVTGIPGYLTIKQPFHYTILLAIAGGIAFALTWVVWKEPEEDIKKAEENKKKAAEKAEDAEGEEKETAKEIIEDVPLGLDDVIITSSAGDIVKPINGKVIPYHKIPDETFASGALGEGVGIEPEGDIVYAPMEGEISSVAGTNHAIGISGPNDQELLIHVGVDTVEMDGDGFTTYVKEGDQVKIGQPLLKFDDEKIKAAGHPDTVVVLLTNSDDYEDVRFGEDLKK